MKVQVTEQDIREAIPDGIDSPLTRALQRATGTQWDVIEGHRYAYESRPPYRVIMLPCGAVELVCAWRNLESITPVEFELGFDVYVSSH